MSFLGLNHEMQTAVQAIALQTLKDYTVEDIVEIGVAVRERVSLFRRNHAEQVPIHPGNNDRGLLGMGPREFDNFELAQYLIGIGDPEILELCGNTKGVPAITAYLAISTGSSTRSSIDLKKAWDYVLAASYLRAEQLEVTVKAAQAAAAHGSKFKGRKPGAVGRARLAVRQVLKKNPSANAAGVWTALKAKPPQGMTLHDNRLGKYIETETGDGIDTTSYRRFATIVSQERNPS